jgi:hypothetical protein
MPFRLGAFSGYIFDALALGVRCYKRGLEHPLYHANIKSTHCSNYAEKICAL